MNQKKPITSLSSIEKCLQILSTFSLDQSQLSIKDICKKYQFNPSSTYRILCHLEEFGYVSRLKNKEYMVGTQAIYLNAIYTHSNHLEQLRPIIDKIRDISSHTASLFIEEDSHCICLYRAHSNIQNHYTLEQGSRLKLTLFRPNCLILVLDSLIVSNLFGKTPIDPVPKQINLLTRSGNKDAIS